MFRKLFNILKTVVRYIIPSQDSIQALLLKTLATDLLRAYLSKNPTTTIKLAALDHLIADLRQIVPIKETTAERVIRAAIHELGLLIRNE